MFVVTFYSFKGGVGRTLALQNIAHLLLQARRKVLIWDFDLEAPGFWHFPPLDAVEPKPGTLDILTDYARTKVFPQLAATYIAHVENGPDVIFAGKRDDPEYRAKLGAIPWDRLYEDFAAASLFEDLRRQLEDAGYQYVLVDSRTGYGDIGGICTLQLADAVALMFGLNRQNLAGAQAVYQVIQEHNANTQRPVAVVPVASPVWPLYSEKVEERLEQARKAFPGVDLRSLSYDTLVAFEEQVIVNNAQYDRLRLAEEYRQLCEAIRLLHPFDTPRLRVRLRELLGRTPTGAIPPALRSDTKQPFDGQTPSAEAEAYRIAEQLAILEWDDYGTLVECADATERLGESMAFEGFVSSRLESHHESAAAYCWRGIRRGDSARRGEAKYEDALADFEKALDLRPDRSMAHVLRGATLDNMGRSKDALAAYNRAIELQPTNLPALKHRGALKNNWGDYEAALEDFEKACQSGPKDFEAHYWRGIALQNLGRIDEALVAYTTALELDPRNAQAWKSRGALRGNRGDHAAALRDFDRACELAPKDSEAHRFRGVALEKLDRTGDALSAYDKALELDPTNARCLYSRGHARFLSGDSKGAAADLREAWEVGPEGITETLNIAELLALTGQVALSGNALEKAESVAKDITHVADCLVVRCVLAAAAGEDVQPAENDLRLYVEANPEVRDRWTWGFREARKFVSDGRASGSLPAPVCDRLLALFDWLEEKKAQAK